MADTLTGFVDQLNAPASSFSALASTSFPSLTDFNASSSSEALKWTDLVQDVVYQIVSTRTVTTQNGQSIIMSLQKADGSCCCAWACGMLTKELLQNPMANLTVICSTYRVEYEQDWESVQFISTATVQIICTLFV